MRGPKVNTIVFLKWYFKSGVMWRSNFGELKWELGEKTGSDYVEGRGIQIAKSKFNLLIINEGKVCEMARVDWSRELMALRREFDVEIRDGKLAWIVPSFVWVIDLGDAKSIVTFVGRDWRLSWCVVECWVTIKM